MSEAQGWLALLLGTVTLLTVVVTLHGGFRDLKEELHVFKAQIEAFIDAVERRFDRNDGDHDRIDKKIDALCNGDDE